MKTTLQEIAGALGWPVVDRLLPWGGIGRMVLPNEPKEYPPCLGAECINQLIERFGGRECDFPRNPGSLHEARDEAIRADRDAGMLMRDLAAKYQLRQWRLQRALGISQEG
jgi:hypothetical protein